MKDTMSTWTTMAPCHMIAVPGEEQEGTDWAELEWIHPRFCNAQHGFSSTRASETQVRRHAPGFTLGASEARGWSPIGGFIRQPWSHLRQAKRLGRPTTGRPAKQKTGRARESLSHVDMPTCWYQLGSELRVSGHARSLGR